MSSKINVGSTHIFSDFSGINTISIVPGPGESLSFPSVVITNLNVTNGTIGLLNSSQATIGSLQANNLTSTSSTITNLLLTSGSIGSFQANSENITNSIITNGSISNLLVSSGSIGSLNTSVGTIGSLQSNNSYLTSSTISNLNVTLGTANSLQINLANISQATIGALSISGFNVSSATIGSLLTTNANISSGTIVSLLTTNANVSSGTIASLFSTNAKITSGTIASLFATNTNITSETMGSLLSTNANISSGTIASLFSTNSKITTGTIGSLLVTNENITNSTMSSLVANTANITSGTINSLALGSLIIPNAVASSSTIGSLFTNSINSSNLIETATFQSTSYVQLTNKIIGLGYSGAATQGASCAMSPDGSTFISAGPVDNGSIGASWVYVKTGSLYVQVGNKVVGSGYSGASKQGGAYSQSLSVSSDGSTFVIGGFQDFSNRGAMWIFSRTGSLGTTYNQVGDKLFGSGSSGTTVQFGQSVAISGDSSTIALSGPGETNGTVSNIGGIWIFIKSGIGYAPQTSKLIGTGYSGTGYNGTTISLSYDGNTLVTGAFQDNTNVGACYVFTRSGTTWGQQGTKLIGSGYSTSPLQGQSCKISQDGDTIVIGGSGDNSSGGAGWIFTRSAGIWSQQGSKIVGIGNCGSANQFYSTSLSASPTNGILLAGGFSDNSNVGASWMFIRTGTTWAQINTTNFAKYIGTYGSLAQQGTSSAMDGLGLTFAIGGPTDNSSVGANWFFNCDNGSLIENTPRGTFINGPLSIQQNLNIGLNIIRNFRTTSFSGTPDTLSIPNILGTGAHLLFLTTTGGGTIGSFSCSADTKTGNYYVSSISGNNIIMSVSTTNLSWVSVNSTSYTGYISWISFGIGSSG